MSNHFRLLKTDGQARAGELITGHGTVPTPVFMPVGSQATVKTITPDELKSIGYPMLLANTYHLYLRPDPETIRSLGGLHKFMAWDRAILTDSGGYQVFSLAPLRQITDEGVNFRSHIDGSTHFFTPERAIQYQEALGADVIMVLDECSPHDAGRHQVERAMYRTYSWAKRCRESLRRSEQLLFAIVQGGLFPDLRQIAAASLVTLDFPGYALGGLSLGESKETMFATVANTVKLLPASKPRYLMGVGSPEDIVEGVALGIDMFDCALPTRVARNGALFTRQGRINIRNAAFKTQDAPVMTDCRCYTCCRFSAAYLHHLFNARELLAYRLATLHNLTFMYTLVQQIRTAILSDSFYGFAADFRRNYQTTDETVRLGQKDKWLRRRADNKAE